jgi:glycosyltransferase involved in cell wall biosynthesis
MLSVIVATHESERALVRTLSALVAGATAGLVSEVIVADAGSRDATAEVADVAGCRFIASEEPLGARLKTAAATARAPWLLFLRAGCVPEPAWVEAVDSFAGAAGMPDDAVRAAVFRSQNADNPLRPGLAELFALLRSMFGSGARHGQGLLIAKRFYDALGGHSGGNDADTELLSRIDPRRVVMLRAGALPAPDEDT